MLAALAALAAFVAVPATSATGGSGPMVRVIIQELPGAGAVPARLVETLGGTVWARLGIIGGFTAEVPASELGQSQSAGHDGGQHL